MIWVSETTVNAVAAGAEVHRRDPVKPVPVIVMASRRRRPVAGLIAVTGWCGIGELVGGEVAEVPPGVVTVTAASLPRPPGSRP